MTYFDDAISRYDSASDYLANTSNIYVPEHSLTALMQYLCNGLAPGGFITSVLCNDLHRAATVADVVNAEHLCDITKFVLYYLPRESYGSREAIAQWMLRTDIHDEIRAHIATQSLIGKSAPEALYEYVSQSTNC